MIRYANYLVLAKTDLEEHFSNELLEKTGEFALRSRTDLKQMDGPLWQLISHKVRKGITFDYRSYRYFYFSTLLSR